LLSAIISSIVIVIASLSITLISTLLCWTIFQTECFRINTTFFVPITTWISTEKKKIRIEMKYWFWTYVVFSFSVVSHEIRSKKLFCLS
jgi:hypothetical protein